MNEDRAFAGAAAKRCLRLLGVAAFLSSLAACSALRGPPPNRPPGEAAQLYPLGWDTEIPSETRLAAEAPKLEEPKPEEPKPQEPKPEEPKPEEPQPEEPPGISLPEDNVLENTRRTVRSSTEWLARGVDSWFGDKPFEQGGGVRDGRLIVGFSKRQDESLDTRVRFNARIRLPNVERRTYLFIGRDNEREVVADTPQAFSRQERLLTETSEDRSFFTGLGFSLVEAFDLRLGFHGIRPYAQARYRQPFALSERDLVELRQTFFWRLRDRLGSTTAYSYEHALSSSVALRWLAAATVTQKTKRYDWSNIFGAYKTFGNERLLSLELIQVGRVGDAVKVSEYGVQGKWLQPVYRDWLFGEFLLGYFWPRVDLAHERAQRWALGFALTMRF